MRLYRRAQDFCIAKSSMHGRPKAWQEDDGGDKENYAEAFYPPFSANGDQRTGRSKRAYDHRLSKIV